MNPILRQIVTKIKEIPKSNPPGENEVDLGTLLQIEIAKSGDDFSEVDVLEAAQAVGVPEGELISWLEDMASWV